MDQYTRIRVNSFDISGYKEGCQGRGTVGIGLGVFSFCHKTAFKPYMSTFNACSHAEFVDISYSCSDFLSICHRTKKSELKQNFDSLVIGSTPVGRTCEFPSPEYACITDCIKIHLSFIHQAKKHIPYL